MLHLRDILSFVHTHTCHTLLYTVVMEDLVGYRKLQDQLYNGAVNEHIPAIVSAFRFIGRVHSTTWVNSLPTEERLQLSQKFE